VLQFYGLGWDELLDLEVVWFAKLYERIPIVQARRLLDWLPILTYPHITSKRDRKKIQDTLDRQAGYERMRRFSTTPAQQEDGWARLRGAGKPPPPLNGTPHG